MEKFEDGHQILVDDSYSSHHWMASTTKKIHAVENMLMKDWLVTIQELTTTLGVVSEQLKINTIIIYYRSTMDWW